MRLSSIVLAVVLFSTLGASSASARPPDERATWFTVHRGHPREFVETTVRPEWRPSPTPREASTSDAIRMDVAATRQPRTELIGPTLRRCERYVPASPDSSKRRCEAYESP